MSYCVKPLFIIFDKINGYIENVVMVMMELNIHELNILISDSKESGNMLKKYKEMHYLPKL